MVFLNLAGRVMFREGIFLEILMMKVTVSFKPSFASLSCFRY